MDDLIDRLAALPTEAESGADGWPEIEAGIGRRRASGGWLRVAAAVAIFAAGGAGGFLARGDLSGAAPRFIDEALVLAAEVQRTGSEYVAALSAFAAVVDSVSVDVRAQGRDAAIATLFGAATELAALDGRADGRLIPRDPADANRVRF